MGLYLHQFELKGTEKVGENEQRTSWILQDGTIELLGYKYEPSFQKREEGPPKQLRDLQGCHSLTIGPECTGQGPGGKWEGQGCLHLFQRTTPLPAKESHILGIPPPPPLQALECCHCSSHSLRDDIATPGSLDDKALSQRGLFSSPKISWNLPCQILDLLGTCHPFLLSYFSLLE